MNKELSFEAHILKRSYTSDARIQTLLATRYAGVDEGCDAALQLTPTVASDSGSKVEKAEKATADFFRAHERKPAQKRARNTRHAMQVYIKSTIAAQKKAAKHIVRARKSGQDVNVAQVLRRHAVPVFGTFWRLHEMWCAYMQDLLFEQANPNLQMVLPRLSTADYNGALLTVVQARDRNLVGMSGIVLYDSQHSFVLVVAPKTEGRTLSGAEEVGGLRVVAKAGTLFGFDVPVNDTDCIGFTILGSRFQIRAVDRASKKFKSHNTDDVV